jgi:hypothetical protein
MNTQSVQSVQKVSSYIELQPLLRAMNERNNRSPKNSLPINTEGTVQSNAESEAIPNVTLYNAHGILTPTRPNALLGIA